MITNPLLPKSTATPAQGFSKLISGALGVFMILAIIYFIFFFIMAGISYISSNGDEKKVTTAKNQLTNAVIGLAVIFLLFAVLKLIGSAFGIDDITNITLPTLF